MFFKTPERKFGTKTAPSRPGLPAATSGINMALKDVITAITNLRDALIKENEALDHANSRAFMDLQDEKVACARRYEAAMNALLDHKDTVNQCDPRLKSILLSLEKGFAKVMADNLVKLERMKGATEKLGERIMRSARKSVETQTQFAYGSSGTMQRGVKASMGLSEQA
jgi:hypothetical protein